MTGFKSPITGGQGALLIPFIQSPNFESGIQGWQIDKNGSVQFNNGTFRGTVSAGTFEGADFVINQTGAWFYDGTPALGNVIIAITTAAATDQYGNFAPGGGVTFFGSSSTSGNANFPVPAATAEHFNAFMTSYLYNAGASDEGQVWQAFGSQEIGATDCASLVFSSSSKDASIGAHGALLYYTTSGVQTYMCQWQSSGVIIGPVSAFKPGTATSSDPLPEAWNTVTTPTGMTGTVRVKMLAQAKMACLDINALITSTSTTATTYNAGSLPAGGYYPTGQRQFDLSVNQQFTNTGNASPRVNIPASGALSLDMPAFDTAGNSCIVSGTVHYPLD